MRIKCTTACGVRRGPGSQRSAPESWIFIFFFKLWFELRALWSGMLPLEPHCHLFFDYFLDRVLCFLPSWAQTSTLLLLPPN
jgi:hypothetical protein